MAWIIYLADKGPAPDKKIEDVLSDFLRAQLFENGQFMLRTNQSI